MHGDQLCVVEQPFHCLGPALACVEVHSPVGCGVGLVGCSGGGNLRVIQPSTPRIEGSWGNILQGLDGSSVRVSGCDPVQAPVECQVLCAIEHPDSTSVQIEEDLISESED